jgi:transformation/transcription domain-associated protein
MKDPSATMPITAQVNKNVEHFIKRAVLMGYIGKNEDKVSDNECPCRGGADAQNSNAQCYHATVTLINQASSLSLLAQMPEGFMAWY